jgi:hypothetical protein
LALGCGWCWVMETMPIELTSILDEIDKALNAKLYYLAIAVALSVPDICASLEFDPDNPARAGQKTFAAWCEASIRPAFVNLTGDDLYYLRCGVLHFGHFGHSKSRFNRIMFIGPESQVKAHDIVVTVLPEVEFGGVSAEELRLSGKILQLDVVQFCQTIMQSARNWALEKSADPFVQRNLKNLVRYRPNGLPPFSVGIPTVA